MLDVGHVLASEEAWLHPAAMVLRGWGVEHLVAVDPSQTPEAVDAALRVYAAWFLLWRSSDRDGEGDHADGGGGFTLDSLRCQRVLHALAQWPTGLSVVGTALAAP